MDSGALAYFSNLSELILKKDNLKPALRNFQSRPKVLSKRFYSYLDKFNSGSPPRPHDYAFSGHAQIRMPFQDLTLMYER